MRITLTNGCLLLIFPLVAFGGAADTNSFFMVTAPDRSFFRQLQNAILSEDTNWLSGAIDLPFTVRTGKRKITLHTRSDVQQYSRSLFGEHLKDVVRKQSPNGLFKNWRGVMVGDGEIWFSDIGHKTESGVEWVYRVIALSPPEEPGSTNRPAAEPDNPPRPKR